jgi:hypothetical protein
VVDPLNGPTRTPTGNHARRGKLAVIRVLPADDQAMVRAGVRLILAAEADITVVGEAGAIRRLVTDDPIATRIVVLTPSASTRTSTTPCGPGRNTDSQRGDGETHVSRMLAKHGRRDRVQAPLAEALLGRVSHGRCPLKPQSGAWMVRC